MLKSALYCIERHPEVQSREDLLCRERAHNEFMSSYMTYKRHVATVYPTNYAYGSVVFCFLAAVLSASGDPFD